jgi:uncharacterized protein
MSNTENSTPEFAQGTQAAAPTDDRMMAMLSHLAMFVLPVIGPVLVMALNNTRSAWLEAHIKAALNFQINVLGWVLLLTIGSFPLSFVTFGLAGLCALLLIITVIVLALIFPILATMKANTREHYVYPLTITILK